MLGRWHSGDVGCWQGMLGALQEAHVCVRVPPAAPTASKIEMPSSGEVVEWAGPSALLLLEGATRFPGQENTNHIPMSLHSQGGGAGGLVRQREKNLVRESAPCLGEASFSP